MMITTFKVLESHRKIAQDIDDRWNEFVEYFFIQKKSYIIPHSEEIFTLERVERVLELIEKREKGNFDEGLKKQFSKATVEEKLIFLHAEWVYLLMSVTGKDARHKKLSRWGDKIRDDVLLEQIIKPGVFFATQQYWFVRFILKLFRDMFSEASEQNKWIEDYCLGKQSKPKSKKQPEANPYSICSALLYVVNPNDYEPIVSKTHKLEIVEHYKSLLDPVDTSDVSVDKNIFNIRQALTKEYGEQHFSFHNDRTEWKENNSSKKDKNPKNNHDSINEETVPYRSFNHPLNQILYGPPGTGKTWNTVNHALAIIEGKSVKEIEKEDRKTLKKRFDELKDGRQIEMVTFHQNFSYEDFIEGIRPILGDAAGNDSGDESSNLQYEIVDGVFKRIADRANDNLRNDNLRQSKSNSTGLNLDALLEAFAEHIEERLADEEEIKLCESRGIISADITKVERQVNGKLRAITICGTGLESNDLLPLEKMLEANVMQHIGRNLSLAECLRRGYWDGGVFQDLKGKRPETAQAAAFYGFKMASDDEMWCAPSHTQMKTLLKNSKYSEIDLTKYFRSLPGVTTAYSDTGRGGRITCGRTSRSAVAIPSKIFHEAGFFPPSPEDGDYFDTFTENKKWKCFLKPQTIKRDYADFYKGEIKSHNDTRLKRLYSALYGKIKEFHATWNPEEGQSKQQDDEIRNYVLIIDEINRGNIAKIFGELITLIEDTKRIGNEDETTVTLPCSSDNDDEMELFGVPNNLYIIGTMNTADRSIALLDTALRRRFDFIEMMPQPYHSLISGEVGKDVSGKDVTGVDCQELLQVMNQRISVLLDREHQIGHSYFIHVDSMKKLSHAFRNKIMPLLQEYFYDDWAKIMLVLNNNKFVTHTKIEYGLFKDTDLVDAEHLIYALIEAKSEEWTKPENYQKIYAIKRTGKDGKDDGE